MEINKHSYEAYFLDYHEGNLTPQQVADLLLFVEQHPELKVEFESFENLTLEDYSDYTFENKEGLKKDLFIDITNQEEYFIRSVEGTLNKTEQHLLSKYLKQHPQFLVESDLFQKTKLTADTSIVFEGKEDLKQIALTNDNLLISAVEGLLSKEENILLKQQLSVDPEMRQEFSLYQQTKLSVDTSVVFENKEELKHKNRKAIPMFYYVSGIAAAILLLFGLFTLFNNGNTEKQNLAVEVPAVLKKSNPEVKSPGLIVNPSENNLKTLNNSNSLAVQKVHIKNKVGISKTIDSLNGIGINESNNNIALNTSDSKQEVPKEQAISKKAEPLDNTTQNTIAKTENMNRAASKEFLSLGQMAATKIKEKTLDDDVLAVEKKSGRLRKLTGWDVAQIVAKGVSKVTGKKVEAKPTYNDEGEVTAFALGAGAFQISRGK
jgi:hypothetical protein